MLRTEPNGRPSSFEHVTQGLMWLRDMGNLSKLSVPNIRSLENR